MSTPATIEVQDLTVIVDQQTLLDSLTLHISSGEHLAIVGANGAGKTTLLRSLLGLITPNSGHIRLNQTPLEKLSRRDLAHQIAYVPQQLPQDIPFSVTEFIHMSRYAFQSALAPQNHTDDQIIQDVIELTGLETFSSRPLNTLSGGERQKASIAAALAQQCSILILDEPCTHLDPAQQASVQTLLSEIGKKEQLTILTVTHDLNWAANRFDRILGLRTGKLLFDGPSRDFMQPDTLTEIFQTSFQTIPHPSTGVPLIIPHA